MPILIRLPGNGRDFAPGGDRHDRPAPRQIVERGGNAILVVRHAGQAQAHFDAAESAGKHKLVEITEMANTENLARDFAETIAERHVEILEYHFAQVVCAVAIGREHGRQ